MEPAIDIHAHIVPENFPAYAGKHGNLRWPAMQPAESGCKHITFGGKHFRTVTDACWDVARRRGAMAAMGVTRQAISPMPELLSYWLPAEDALSLVRYVNDEIQRMVSRDPAGFVGLGTVPLQEPELAAKELERLMRDAAFRGVEIGSNVAGVPLGDQRFEPFFAAAEELGAAVFVHALHPTGDDRLVGPPAIRPYISFPLETAFAIASLITGGVLSRHGKLKLAFSHGGGGFALVMRRLEHGWNRSKAMKELLAESPTAQARRLYYDMLVYDSETIQFLIDSFGKTQLCLGTDHPFDIHDRDPIGRLAPLGLDAATRTLLLAGNAARFLGV